MDIVVLAGGYSYERDVSLASGSLAANALIENGHRVLLIDLYLGLNNVDTFEDAYNRFKKDHYTYEISKRLPDLDMLKKRKANPRELVGENIIPICQTADAVFLSLHGEIGENGQLQALFDLYGICYTGSDYFSSALAMNKFISKELMRQNNILTPDWELLKTAKDIPEMQAPCVVKPNANGSSIGISIIENNKELQEAINAAQAFSSSILLEKKVEGREFSVGILGNDALPVIEIIPKHGFYDYENKYQEGATHEICPAELDLEVTLRMQERAKKVHNILQLGYYSRIDFILDEDGKMYCIEANSLPGMTPTSLFPQEAAAANISFNELCEKLIQSAVEKK